MGNKNSPMKKVLFAALVVFLSCNVQPICSYCLFKTETTNTQKKDGRYIYSTDSVIVSYFFWENRGIMQFSIYNNTDKPIYVDWKNSEYVVNNIGIHYWEGQETVETTGFSNTDIYYIPGTRIMTATQGETFSSSTIYKPDRVLSIAPKTEIDIGHFRIIRDGYHPSYEDTTKVFTQTTTPYSFRNYIVLSKTEDLKTPFYVDNSFYVHDIKIVKDADKHFSRESFYVVRTAPKARPSTNVFGQ